MDKQGNQTKTRTPIFDGLNYVFWSVRMRLFLQAQGIDVWKVVVNGYNVPATLPIDNAGRKLHEYNSKAMNEILSGLVELVFVKVMHCESAKEVWDKLKNINEGDEKVKGTKL